MTGTERKVFQKYYPPDFDPAKIPKAKQPRNRQFIQRVMTPFNMRCNTCNEYIYKGKKFNMRRETAEGENYLGLKIFRFYFRCPNCLAEITFKTDIENVDYQAEHGATRLFDAFKFYQEQEKREEEKEEEEKADAMKMLEKRTKMSKIEMEALGHIEELQESNRRHEKIDAIAYINETEEQQAMSFAEQIQKQEEDDEREVQRLVGRTNNGQIERRLNDDGEEDQKQQKGDIPSTSSSSAPMFAMPSAPRAQNSIGKMPIKSSSSLSLVNPSISKRKNNQAAILGGIILKKKK